MTKIKLLIAFLMILAMFFTFVPMTVFAENTDTVRLKETGDKFGTLKEAIAAAQEDGYTIFTLEIIGNFTESINNEKVLVTSDITIVGTEGEHTIKNSYIYVQDGGSLTLGEGNTENTLTISGFVNVSNGAIDAKDGVIIKSSSYALTLSSISATGTISGGYFEGENGALSLEKSAYISEISGGEFRGKQEAVHLSDTDTKIGIISDGAFYQTDPNSTLHGQAIYLQNNSRIGEISGGYFQSACNNAMIMIRGGWVDEISGGKFVSQRTDGANAVIRVYNGSDGAKYAKTGIGTISGGHLSGAHYGVLLFAAAGSSIIEEISGGTFEGEIALQNDAGAVIDKISGGNFRGNNHGILNAGTIKDICDKAYIIGQTKEGIYNYKNGKIEEISGGTIVSSSSSGIINNGTITNISGGTIIGEHAAINCIGTTIGTIGTISNGVFWGKNMPAICLASGVILEPGLQAELGLGRYWGGNGEIFNSEDLVSYPGEYKMSMYTVPVTGIADIEFKYLTHNFDTKPIITVTYNANGGTDDNELDEFSLNTSDDPYIILDSTNASFAFTHDDYAFIEWNTLANGNGDRYLAGAQYTENNDITLFAQWAPLYSYTIKYYKGSVAPANEILPASSTTSLAKYTVNYAIQPTDVDADFPGWLNLCKPAGGYQDGAVSGSLPAISGNGASNVVNVVYLASSTNPDGSTDPDVPTSTDGSTDPDGPTDPSGGDNEKEEGTKKEEPPIEEEGEKPSEEDEQTPEEKPEVMPESINPLPTPEPIAPSPPTNGGRVELDAKGFYVFIGEDGKPLGRYTLAEDDKTWIYAPYTPLGNLPQTGVGSNLLPIALLLLGLLALGAGLVLRTRKR